MEIHRFCLWEAESEAGALRNLALGDMPQRKE